jgi:hypothetical protein
MTTSFPTLVEAQQRLAYAISDFHVPTQEPLDISPWVAMSLLQKSIRRGRVDFALRAAATLLVRSPENLWRRCGGIVFEDIGLADPGIVALVTAALTGKRHRAGLGGEWPVASFVTSCMASAAKCRAADDLLMAAELDPRWSRQRLEFSYTPTSGLMDIALGGRPLPERAIALWYAVGTGWRGSRYMQRRKGQPNYVFDALEQVSGMASATGIAREGFRKTGEVLCALVPLLAPNLLSEASKLENDLFPPELDVGGVPSWTYDVYSREGREALRAFGNGPSDTANWVRTHIPLGRRAEFLGSLVFRVEGGLVQRRLCWPTASVLKRMVDLGSHGPECPDATEILAQMRHDIPQLNGIRANACG